MKARPLDADGRPEPDEDRLGSLRNGVEHAGERHQQNQDPPAGDEKLAEGEARKTSADFREKSIARIPVVLRHPPALQPIPYQGDGDIDDQGAQ
ncbi:hypothetical protein SDC9_168809 [bioreactor metagenome]|uniref:Uncharacterized protein n=1 Tax=bioreactor metagenome TaxID=1076179 RepID=A0A645G661_9ZZZZ